MMKTSREISKQEDYFLVLIPCHTREVSQACHFAIPREALSTNKNETRSKIDILFPQSNAKNNKRYILNNPIEDSFRFQKLDSVYHKMNIYYNTIWSKRLLQES